MWRHGSVPGAPAVLPRGRGARVGRGSPSLWSLPLAVTWFEAMRVPVSTTRLLHGTRGGAIGARARSGSQVVVAPPSSQQPGSRPPCCHGASPQRMRARSRALLTLCRVGGVASTSLCEPPKTCCKCDVRLELSRVIGTDSRSETHVRSTGAGMCTVLTCAGSGWSAGAPPGR